MLSIYSAIWNQRSSTTESFLSASAFKYWHLWILNNRHLHHFWWTTSWARAAATLDKCHAGHMTRILAEGEACSSSPEEIKLWGGECLQYWLMSPIHKSLRFGQLPGKCTTHTPSHPYSCLVPMQLSTQYLSGKPRVFCDCNVMCPLKTGCPTGSV